MHILHETLRSDARRTNMYACASILSFRTNCTILLQAWRKMKFS